MKSIKLIIALLAVCCNFVYGQTWTGNVSTSWNTPGNWSTNAVPIATGNVTIPDGLANYPLLASNVTINSMNMEAGSEIDFNGYQLSIVTGSGYTYIRGATLKSSSGLITLNVDNGVSGYATYFGASTIEDDFVLNFSGGSAFIEGHQTGNIFQGAAVFNVAGTGALWTSTDGASIFQDDLTITRTVGGLMDLFNSGGSVAGNLSITNPIGGGALRIGIGTETTFVEGMINISANFNGVPNTFEMLRVINNTTGGIIDVKNSLGFNVRNDTLKLSQLSLLGFRGSAYAYLYENHITSNVAVEDSITSGSGYHTYLRNNVFTGQVSIVRNGQNSLYEADGATSSNIFNGPLSIQSVGTGSVYLSHNSKSTYNGNVSLNSSGTGLMQLFSQGATINGNFSFANSSTGHNLIGTLSQPTDISGIVNVNIDNPNAGRFEMLRVVNQTNGGEIVSSSSTGFYMNSDTLSVNRIVLQNVYGSSYGEFYNSYITGNLSISDAATASAGYHIYVRNSTIIGNVDFTMNSNRNVYISDAANQPIAIVGNVDVTLNGSCSLLFGGASSLNITGNVSINRIGDGDDDLYKTGSILNGDFSYTNSSASDFSMGSSSSSTVISGKIDININNSTPASCILNRIINQTTGGNIYVNNARGVEIENDTLKTNVTLSNIAGTMYTTLYNSLIEGNTQVSTAVNPVTTGYHAYVRSSVFNGNVTYVSNSSNNFYDSDNGTGNIYNDNVTYTRTGSGNFQIGSVANTYNDNVEMVDHMVNTQTIQNAIFSSPTGSELTMNGNTINHLTLNTPQLVLNGDMQLNNSLTFQSGILSPSSSTPNARVIFKDNATHSGASASSHISVIVQKDGNDAFTFPVGSGIFYAPVSMTAPLVVNSFSAQYISDNPTNASMDTANRAGLLEKVTGFEYWNFSRISGSATPTLTFAFNDPFPGVANYITDPSSVRIARWSGTLWESKGNSAYTGSTSGTITSEASINDFGFFTFATTNMDLNPFMTQAFVYYLDADGDGFGDVNNFINSDSPTPPTGYVTNSSDCDDSQLLYADGDNDGFGTGSPTPCGVPLNTDCNDADNSVYPGATELCDGKDNDCDGDIDEGVGATWYVDMDEDGFGNSATSVISCTQPTGYVSNSLDCNDGDDSIFPGATEVCDGKDNNCNGDIDDGVGTTWYADADGDGFGDANVSTTACNQPVGYVSNASDCNDADFTVYPNAPELCDGKDNDCNGIIDDGAGTFTYYRDADGDGYGDAGVSVVACSTPVGYVTNNTDCDDDDNTVYPSAPELCDGKDNDCDGDIDEGVGATWYADSDADGFGDASVSVVACTQPVGYVTNSLDCNDADNTVYPGAPELCDGIDNDCDGQIDEDGGVTWYVDNDGDGFGDASVSVVACTQPVGYVTNSLDCDDDNNTVYPGAIELCDGIDNNCNGIIDDGSALYFIEAITSAGGTISPAGISAVTCGSSQVYIIQANVGYVIADVLIDGVSVGAVATYTFTNVSASHSIAANFTAVGSNTYTITATAGVGGAISPSGASVVDEGTSINYTITTDPCYAVSDVLVDGVSVGAVSSYTFNNVTANHTIAATFDYMPAPRNFVGIKNVCPFEGTSTVLTYSVEEWAGATYNWIVPPTTTLVSGQGTNSIELTINAGFGMSANKQIKVRAVWPCGISAMSIYYLSAQGPETPAAIVASSTDVCTALANATTITYIIPKTAGAASYNWIVEDANTIIEHPNGAGENDTTINVTFLNGFATSYIRVQSQNNCGVGGFRSILVTRENPSAPTPISGPIVICEHFTNGGTPATYSVATSTNVDAYTWSVPSGVTNLTGQGTNTISFSYPDGYSGGEISVVATNGCGTGAVRTLRVSTLQPGAPSAITATEVSSCPVRVYTYSITNTLPSGSSVVWSVPTSGTITSGQGTTSITVEYSSAIAGQVTAQIVNGCSSSSVRKLSVKMDACQDMYARNLEVDVFPNPSTNVFNVKFNSFGKSTIKVNILDAQGKVMKSFTALPMQTMTIGEKLRPGVYFVEFIHGNTKTVKRILKQ